MTTEALTNRTQDELAEAMYGAPAEQPAAEQAPAETEGGQHEGRSQDELAAAIYDREPDAPLESVSEELQALRDEPARRMYDPEATFGKIIHDQGFAEHLGAKEGRRIGREFRAMLADVDFSSSEASQLKAISARYRENPPDPKVQQAAAREALRNEFGNDHEQALADALQLVRRDRRWAQLLTSSGLGNDPEVVMMFARKARALRTSGKIK